MISANLKVLEYPKEPKFRNKKCEMDGIKFDSMREMKRYSELKILQRAGLINQLELQRKFELIPAQKGKVRNERAVSYIADFFYFDKQKLEWIAEDSKGVRTKDYVLKRKMMRFFLGIEIVEV